jgi:hypothetical protein
VYTVANLQQLVTLTKALHRLAPAAVEATALLILFLGFVVIHFGAPLEVISAFVVFSVAVVEGHEKCSASDTKSTESRAGG